ncbi:MAG: HAMP domain-containing histidine kinase [Alphaproteobacteria bacterium]|nr:HAMP domain-containing histidine kinase [Alphaproteobacteria bacterium]
MIATLAARVRANPVAPFAIVAVMVIALVCAAAFTLVDRRFERILDARDARAAELELRVLRDIDRAEGRAGLERALARRVDAFGSDVEVYALADPQGQVLAGSIDYPIGFVPDGAWRPYYDVDDPDEPVGYARATRLRDGALLLAGVDFSDRASARAALTQAFMLALAAVLAAAFAVGALLNRLILARIDQVVATTQRIMKGDLDERVPTTASGGAFDHLAGALNAMLDRIAALITQMRAVTDAIAHDLRLPLQRVRSGLERAATQDDAETMRTAIGAAMGEADEALATFDLLLGIARAQSGVGRDSFAPVALATLIEDVAEVFGPYAEEAGVTLVAQPVDITAEGNSVLLRQALGNLVHNAVKYVGAGGHVTLSARAGEDGIDLVVQDDGPGIPAEFRDAVVQPFGRLERDAKADGKGLGLAFVQACAKLHGGALILAPAEPGLRAILRLPRRARPPE